MEPRHIYRVGQGSVRQQLSPIPKNKDLGPGKCDVLDTKPDTRRLKVCHVC